MFFNNPTAFFAQPIAAQGFAKNIVTDGLILYLDAGIAESNPGSGTTWSDLSGNGYDFTLYNGAAFGGSGATAYAEFDGSNDYAQNNSSVLAQIGALTANTVQMTVLPLSNTEEDLWSTNDIGGQGSFLLMILDTNKVRNHLWTNGGVGVPDNTNGGTISGNFQLGGGWSWDTGLIYAYRAGQTTVSVSLPGSQPTSAYTKTNLATRFDGGGAFYLGRIYNIVVYNRLLTDAERGQNFTALAV